jgi:hypothetical protein
MLVAVTGGNDHVRSTEVSAAVAAVTVGAAGAALAGATVKSDSPSAQARVEARALSRLRDRGEIELKRVRLGMVCLLTDRLKKISPQT